MLFICYFSAIERNSIAKDKSLQKVAKQDYEYIKLHISNGFKIVLLLESPKDCDSTRQMTA